MTQTGIHSSILAIQLDGTGSLACRLYRGIRGAILDRRLPAGARLPSMRDLAAALGLSRKVIASAYAQLADEGYVEGRHGAGTFVSGPLPDAWPLIARAPRAAAPARLRASAYASRVMSLSPWPPPGARLQPPPLHDFRYGVPALTDFPQRVWARLVSRRAQATSLRALGYGRTLGYQPLRRAVADYLVRARGVVTTEEQVIIVNGSQQALDLLARLLIDQGDHVVVEEPSYQGARQVFQAAGARILPVSVDALGLQVKQLPRNRGARLAYVTPSHQFPLGAVMPLDRRMALLRWAEAESAYIIEDDYDSEFRYEGRPLAALQGIDRGSRVIYVGTFSKVLAPSMRIAYLVLPPALVPVVASLKFLTDYHTATFEQEVLADFIEAGHFERHVRRTRRRNAARRQALLDACAELFGDRVEMTGTSAGVHVVMWLREVRGEELASILEEAASRGVALYPITPFYLQPQSRADLLLGYACLSERDIRDGMSILRDILDHRRAAGRRLTRRRPS